MLDAPREVLEEEESVITTCISISEKARLEREIVVMFLTVTDPRNQQGIDNHMHG